MLLRRCDAFSRNIKKILDYTFWCFEMRKRDKKSNVFDSTGKAAKTINFDKIVLERLEDLADREGTTVSTLLNHVAKKLVLNDIEYYRYMAKHHMMEFQKYNYLKNEQMEKQGIDVLGEK